MQKRESNIVRAIRRSAYNATITTALFILSAAHFQHLAANTAQTLFGKHGITFGKPTLNRVSKLFKDLAKLSHSEQALLSLQLRRLLRAECKKLASAELYAHNPKKKKNLKYEHYLCLYQIEQTTEHIESCRSKMAIQYRFKSYLQSFYAWLARHVNNVIGKKYFPIPLERLAHRALWYTHFERSHIFSNTTRTKIYLSLQQISSLPEVLNFWSAPLIQQKLIDNASTFSPSVRVQGFIEGLLELGIQATIMAGGSMAEQWVSQADEKHYEQLHKEESDMQKGLTQYRNKMAQKQAVTMNALNDALTANMTQLGRDYSATASQLSKNILYLKRSIHLAQPQYLYLSQPILLDQLFVLAPMWSPNNGYTWYNINQYGNWEYDSTSNSFIQREITPFKSAALAANNSIFTEYITPEDSYQIAGTITLIDAHYPFFAGVMFNKARWLSGDAERLHQYRLLGFYGQKKNNTETIDLCFAQMQYNPKLGAQAVKSPLQCITDPQDFKSLMTLSATEVRTLTTEILAYNFVIQTKPTDIAYKVWKQGTSEPKTFTTLSSKIGKNLRDYVFLYGGIGFMSPGCIAQFSLTQPSALTYTTKHIQSFKNEISQQLKQYKGT